jgi:hypothetical protein
MLKVGLKQPVGTLSWWPRGVRLSPRTLKFLALGYSLKIILLGLVCLMIPDLPARAMGKARQLWTAVGGPSTR